MNYSTILNYPNFYTPKNLSYPLICEAIIEGYSAELSRAIFKTKNNKVNCLNTELTILSYTGIITQFFKNNDEAGLFSILSKRFQIYNFKIAGLITSTEDSKQYKIQTLKGAKEPYYLHFQFPFYPNSYPDAIIHATIHPFSRQGYISH